MDCGMRPGRPAHGPIGLLSMGGNGVGKSSNPSSPPRVKKIATVNPDAGGPKRPTALAK